MNLEVEAAIAVTVADELRPTDICFVGVGLPSAAALVARATRLPGLFCVYESGTMGVAPEHLPLSVADPELARTAQTIVSVPEVFAYWLQPGRVDVGLLGAAQIDRFGNVNSTVIGPYERPRVRLPGAGGAPEIASASGRIVIMLRQSVRSFVAELDFVSTVGLGQGPGTRERWGFRGRGPVAVVTDVGLYEPDPVSLELTLTALQPGRTLQEAQAKTGWKLAVAPDLRELRGATSAELAALEALHASVGSGSVVAGESG